MQKGKSGRILKSPVFINDTGHRQRFPELRSARVVNASTIRNKLFKELQPIAQRKKFDVIFTVGGGSDLILFSPELRKLGKKIVNLPSPHGEKGHDWWHSLVNNSISRRKDSLVMNPIGRCKNPNILILESDIGTMYRSTNRLSVLREYLQHMKENAHITVAVGVAADLALHKVSDVVDICAFRSPTGVTRISELEEYIGEKSDETLVPYKKKLAHEKKHGMTGDVPYS